jgi:hypothetical protein
VPFSRATFGGARGRLISGGFSGEHDDHRSGEDVRDFMK